MRLKSWTLLFLPIRSVSANEEVTDLLSGLCSRCYRSLAECHCDEMANQPELTHSSPRPLIL